MEEKIKAGNLPEELSCDEFLKLFNNKQCENEEQLLKTLKNVNDLIKAFEKVENIAIFVANLSLQQKLKLVKYYSQSEEMFSKFLERLEEEPVREEFDGMIYREFQGIVHDEEYLVEAE